MSEQKDPELQPLRVPAVAFGRLEGGSMTPDELEKLHAMRNGLRIFINALAEIEEKHQQNMDIRRAVAERGRLIQVALDDLCTILEAKSGPDRGE